MSDRGALEIWLDVQSAGRLDVLLLAELQRTLAPELSRARLKEMFRTDAVLLDQRPASPSSPLSPGRYAVSILGAESLQAAPAVALASERGSFLSIVYEDRDLLVLNKLSGVPSVPLSRDERETAVGSALAHDPSLAHVGRAGLEPGLLHRLDTGTSGLLAFARTQEAYARLHAAWKTPGGVRKVYRAIAAPLEHRLPHTVRLTLGHDARSSKRMTVLPPLAPDASAGDARYRLSQIRGKPLESVTRLVQCEKLKTQPLCDFHVEIDTGFMHQIRCTLAHLGSPILGDPIYGGQPAARLWLHAWRLRFPMPQGGELWLQSALPDGWPA